MEMDTAYLLTHVRDLPDADEVIKVIGVYRSHADAAAAIQRVVTQPGFRDHPEGFHIDAYPLNKDHWAEGFISWADALDSDK